MYKSLKLTERFGFYLCAGYTGSVTAEYGVAGGFVGLCQDNSNISKDLIGHGKSIITRKGDNITKTADYICKLLELESINRPNFMKKCNSNQKLLKKKLIF